MFLHQLCQALEKNKIPYAIVGGYAVALHGVVRGTVDIDLVVKWTLENLLKLEQTLIDLGLVSKLPITAENLFYFRDEYIKNRHLIAWNFYDPKNPLRQIDIIITYSLKNEEVDTIATAEGKIKVLSVKCLIEMKQKSGRPQDIEDVKALENL